MHVEIGDEKVEQLLRESGMVHAESMGRCGK